MSDPVARTALPLIIGSLLLALGCGGNDVPTGPTFATLAVTTTTLFNGILTVDSGTETLTATGGDGSYSWALASGSGPLPTGLDLAANGGITGTPTVAEIRNFTVEVTSGDGQTDTQVLSITVKSPLPLTILIDASRDGGIWWFPQAGSFDASEPHQGKELADYLRSQGNEVVELGRGVQITDELLSTYDKVIRAGLSGIYTASELAAYDRYVSRSDAHLILIPHSLGDGEVDLVSESIGLPMEGMHSGVMSPVGTTDITQGVGSITYGPGSAVGPSPTAAITPLGTLGDGSVVMGLVTSQPAKILFLGDLRLLEPVPQPLVSNLLNWLSSGTPVRPLCTAVPTFADANLEAAIRTALMLGAQDALTCDLVSGLEELDASSAGIMSLAGIENLTSLTTLVLHHNSVSDLGPLSGLTSLTDIDLISNEVTDISALSGLTNLIWLELSGNEVSDLSPLSGLPSLASLFLHFNRANDLSLSPLSGLTNLRNLGFDNSSISDSDIVALSGLTGLTSLFLGINQITDISPLSGLTNLTWLTLYSNEITNITALKGLTSLGDPGPKSEGSDDPDLDLSNNPGLADIQPLLDNGGLGDGDIVDLQGTNVSCTDVAALEVKGVTVTSDCGPLVLQPSELCSDNPASSIATFEDANLEAEVRAALGVGAQDDLTCDLISGLTILVAGDAGITSLVGIQNLTSLTGLVLVSNSISDISPLSGLTSLTDLRLQYNNLISDISALSGLTSLSFLNLDENLISDISALSGLTSLTFLTLGGNSISDISALSELTGLTFLTIEYNLISDISAVSGLTSLTTLHLHNNSIGDISPLSGLTSLTFLHLQSNTTLSNIQPLLDNSDNGGLGTGDEVTLRSTSVSCTDVTALEAKGVSVASDCP